MSEQGDGNFEEHLPAGPATPSLSDLKRSREERAQQASVKKMKKALASAKLTMEQIVYVNGEDEMEIVCHLVDFKFTGMPVKGMYKEFGNVVKDNTLMKFIITKEDKWFSSITDRIDDDIKMPHNLHKKYLHLPDAMGNFEEAQAAIEQFAEEHGIQVIKKKVRVGEEIVAQILNLDV